MKKPQDLPFGQNVNDLLSQNKGRIMNDIPGLNAPFRN